MSQGDYQSLYIHLGQYSVWLLLSRFTLFMQPHLIKYNVHVLIASFILLTHLSEQGEYTYNVWLLISIFTLLTQQCFNEIQCCLLITSVLPH